MSLPASPLSIPFEPHEWLDDRKARLKNGLERLAHAARNGTIPGGSIVNGTLKLDRLTADVPAKADQLVLDLYRRIPEVRITDLLLDVSKATRSPCLLSLAGRVTFLLCLGVTF